MHYSYEKRAIHHLGRLPSAYRILHQQPDAQNDRRDSVEQCEDYKGVFARNFHHAFPRSSTYPPDQLEGLPAEVVEQFSAKKDAAARVQAEIIEKRWKINALRKRIGTFTSFFVKRKLDHADFPVADSPKHCLYEILTADGKLAILETRTTEFISYGWASLFLIPKVGVEVRLTSGSEVLVPVFLEAAPEDVQELRDILAEMPCAE